MRRRRRVAIEFGMWRSGRIGGASGSVTFGNGRFREDRGGPVLRGESSPARRSGSRRQRCRGWRGGGSRASRAPRSGRGRVPASVPDNRARSASAAWRDRPSARRRCRRAGSENQYLVGSSASAATRSAAIPRCAASLSRSSRWAARTRTRAKREVSQSAEPSRQVTVCHASSGRPSASALTWTGWCSASRRDPAGRPAAPGPGFRRQRCHPGRPDRGVRLDAGDVAQAERGDRGAQPGVAAVAGVHQHDARRHAGGHARRGSASSAISGLVANPTSSGTPAWARRAASAAHSSGRYSR